MQDHPLVSLVLPLSPCHGALGWLRSLPPSTTPAEAWESCPRGDWMLWLAGSTGVDRKLLVLAACDCAEQVLHLVPAGEERPRKAIETARRWVRGEATIEEVMDAADAAADAAARAYAAAYAADAAADAAAAAYAADATLAAAESAMKSWRPRGLSGDDFDAPMWRATRAAEQAREEARATLTAAIGAAAWGPQPDGSFITCREFGTNFAENVTLHLPGKGGPIASVVRDRCGDGSDAHGLVVRTRGEARVIREREREQNRKDAAAYADARRAAGEALRSGARLPYVAGQNGGRVLIDLPKGQTIVGAVGALTAAGFTKAQALTILDAGDECRMAVLGYHTLSLAGVEPASTKAA